MEMFLERVGLFILCANIIFEDYKKVLQYDLEDASENLKINDD